MVVQTYGFVSSAALLSSLRIKRDEEELLGEDFFMIESGAQPNCGVGKYQGRGYDGQCLGGATRITYNGVACPYLLFLSTLQISMPIVPFRFLNFACRSASAPIGWIQSYRTGHTHRALDYRARRCQSGTMAQAGQCNDSNVKSIAHLRVICSPI